MIALTVNGSYNPETYPDRPIQAQMSRAFVVFGTMYSYLIINVIVIAGFVIDEPISKRIVSADVKSYIGLSHGGGIDKYCGTKYVHFNQSQLFSNSLFCIYVPNPYYKNVGLD